MIQSIIQIGLPIWAGIASTIGMISVVYKLGRYGIAHMRLEREIKPRSRTPYPIQKPSWFKAFWAVNVSSYSFWWRSNPVTFAGHVLYHTGLFIGVGTYGVVALLKWRELLTQPIYKSMLLVCDWFNFKSQIFGTTGRLAAFGEVMTWAFVFALVIAVIGIATPLVMSKLGLRGMTRPLDSNLRDAGITRTSGLRFKGPVGIQRKFVGYLVLVMDAAMLATFAFPMVTEITYIIHVGFGLVLMSMIGSSFLAHEWTRWRMATAMLRVRNGSTA